MDKLPRLTLTEQIMRMEVGGYFYTETLDRVVASYATRAGVKIQTERMLVIHPAKRTMQDITRVTILAKDGTTLSRKAKTIEKTAVLARKQIK